MSKMIVIDVQECMACRTCEIECALAHTKSKTLEEAMNEGQPRVNVEAAQEFAVPMQCRHCEDAPCVKICPTKAIHRKDPLSPVLIEQDRCIGCNFCISVCPFGVIEPSYDGQRIIKCDLCFERLETGQEPACVASCPMNALKFVDAEKYVQDKRKDAAEGLAVSAKKENTN
jgi:carbon-monoxide dehydrogenase iron sulfur subunit